MISIYECGLLVHDSHRLKAQSFVHATSLSGSICESGLSVHNSHRLKTQSYLHATYHGGSICVSGLSVQEDTKCSTELLQSVAVVDRQATFTDTSTRISSMEIALCLQSVTVVD